MDPFAYQIHADARPDRRDIPGTQQFHDCRKRIQNIFLGNDHFRMLAADVIRDHARILQIDSIDIHADGKGADRVLQHLLRDRTDQGRVKAA